MADSTSSSAPATQFVGTRSATTFERAWRLSAPIEGWLSESQARVLAHAAEEILDGSWIVEVGSHHGKATILMAKAKPPATRLLAVDPFDDSRWGGGAAAFEVFESNLAAAEVASVVSLFRGTSAEAAARWSGDPVGLLYVDGAHDRQSVLGDIRAWEPFLREHSVVLFHDAFSSVGVTLALLQRHLVNRRFRYIGSVASLAIFRREDQSTVAATVDALRLTARLGYFARNLAVKLAVRKGRYRIAALFGHRDTGCPF
jgi:predicted O-methyltransferase YrrM